MGLLGQLAKSVRAFHGSPRRIGRDIAAITNNPTRQMPRMDTTPSGADSPAMRMARAERMGFHTQMPLFHGTAADFAKFDLRRGGTVTGNPVAQRGVFAALDADTAGEFAELAVARGTGDSRNIKRLLHRAERPARLRLHGRETNEEIAATLEQAWDDGFDAVLMDNYTTPGGKTGRQIIVVRNPNQLRSVNAAFDPARRNSANLQAGIALPAAVGAGAGLTARERGL